MNSRRNAPASLNNILCKEIIQKVSVFCPLRIDYSENVGIINSYAQKGASLRCLRKLIKPAGNYNILCLTENGFFCTLGLINSVLKDMTEFDENFEKVTPDVTTTSTSIGNIGKNKYMVCMARPCKVIEYSTSRSEKTGKMIASITSEDIFNKKIYKEKFPISHNCDVPIIKRSEWTVMRVDDAGYISLIGIGGNLREDLKLPNETQDDAELSKRLIAALEDGKEVIVTVLAAMGIEKIIEFKEG